MSTQDEDDTVDDAIDLEKEEADDLDTLDEEEDKGGSSSGDPWLSSCGPGWPLDKMHILEPESMALQTESLFTGRLQVDQNSDRLLNLLIACFVDWNFFTIWTI